MGGSTMNVRLLSIFLFTSLLCSNIAEAQIRFLHNSKQISLPAPGAEVKIQVSLQGTREIKYPLEVEVLRDGKLFFVTVPQAFYGRQKEPVYTFSVASPEAGLGYRFRITDEKGMPWTSEYFFALQKCEQPPRSSSHKNKSGSEAQLLADEATLLEGDISAYLYATKRLADMRELLGLGGESQ
ncbi:MAG: hypothetical protein KDD60_04515 [Bdellovibrionales bacterium]|nr:hypothetical protein [Bdellovibrionales bacterium]